MRTTFGFRAFKNTGDAVSEFLAYTDALLRRWVITSNHMKYHSYIWNIENDIPKSYQIKEHYPELVASAREFHIRDQPKFLTDTLKILPGILLLLPQVSRAHCMRKHQTNPIQRNLSRR